MTHTGSRFCDGRPGNLTVTSGGGVGLDPLVAASAKAAVKLELTYNRCGSTCERQRTAMPMVYGIECSVMMKQKFTDETETCLFHPPTKSLRRRCSPSRLLRNRARWRYSLRHALWRYHQHLPHKPKSPNHAHWRHSQLHARRRYGVNTGMCNKLCASSRHV